MKPIDILYFIEHAARELDTACAVKYLAQSQYNISIEIRSIVLGVDETLAQFSPKVVVLPYCVSVKGMNLEKIVSRWPNAKYLNLSYEQLLGKAQKKFKAPKDDFSRNYVIHHAWGEFFSDFLKESGIPESNIVINGNPSFVLYRNPYKQFYGNSRLDLANKFNLDPEKRWVFIPENYGWAFFKNNMIRDRIRRGFDAEQAYLYRDFSVDSLHEAAIWWCEGARMDEVELIVRPRPAVPQTTFIETLEGMVGELPEQLHIIKYGSVREWILASDIVISSYSTTLLEAATARKSLYMLVPFPFPEFIHVDWNDHADKLKTKDAFLDAITQPDLTENWRILESWVIQNMMSQGDPINNLVDLLNSIYNGEIKVPEPLPVARLVNRPSLEKTILQIRKLGWNSMQHVLKFIGVKTYAQGWNPHETDRVTPEDVGKRVLLWEKVLG
jgi:surface carbohydrate biosynthesis protein